MNIEAGRSMGWPKHGKNSIPVPHWCTHYGQSGSITETKKPSVLLGSDGARGLLITVPMTPTGIEPVLPP